MAENYSKSEAALLAEVVTLSRWLFGICIFLIAAGAVFIAYVGSKSIYGAIALGVGTSMLASLILQSLYERLTQERLLRRVAAETAGAAVAYTRQVLNDQYVRILPKRTYPRSLYPTEEFQIDLAGLIKSSKFYHHKGDNASFAAFRLSEIAWLPAISRMDEISFCILDPREDKVLRQQARVKLRVDGQQYDGQMVTEKAKQMREEVFTTLMAFFDMRSVVRVNVALSRESLFFRSEIFEGGAFVSYYLGGDYPSSYLFPRSTYIYDAFALNFGGAIECAMCFHSFTDSFSEADFCDLLNKLECEHSLEKLREMKVALHEKYKQSLAFSFRSVLERSANSTA